MIWGRDRKGQVGIGAAGRHVGGRQEVVIGSNSTNKILRPGLATFPRVHAHLCQPNSWCRSEQNHWEPWHGGLRISWTLVSLQDIVEAASESLYITTNYSQVQSWPTGEQMEEKAVGASGEVGTVW